MVLDMDDKINIMIADDHCLITNLIEQDLKRDENFQVVAKAADGEQALELLEKHPVDVLLLDISMPKVDGMIVLKQARKLYPDLKIIILSNLSNGWIIKKAIQEGANGYLTKFSTCEELSSAIHSVKNNNPYFCRTSFTNLMNILSNKNDGSFLTDNNPSPVLDKNNQTFEYADHFGDYLTAREKKILQMIVEGATTKDIAKNLYLSTRTVETHRKNILQKYGVNNTLGLIKLVIGKDVNAMFSN
jgi:DNA-binding NarL/FixJ family response regulator